MNTIKFHLEDYHAISDADIALDGITVLAGINGCGKSTLVKWIFYLINSMNDFEKSCYSQLCERFNERLSDIGRIEVNFHFRGVVFDSFINLPFEEKEKFPEVVNEITSRLSDTLTNILDPDRPAVNIDRIRKFFNSDSEGNSQDDLNTAIKNYFKTLADSFCEQYEEFKTNSIGHGISLLFENIRHDYFITDDIPESIQICEDDINLLDNGIFQDLMSLRSAIYIDSSIPTFTIGAGNPVNARLTSLIGRAPGKSIDEKTKAILQRLSLMIGGQISRSESSYRNVLRYLRYDGLDIPLREAASGIQSVAYLYMLLAGGHLNRNTLLLIDEPEIHLHPQWIVEYARILVLLHKELGIRVVLASHSPDMVAGLQAIADKYGIIENVHFYQAEELDNTLKYTFKDSHKEVSDIFSSFNAAINKLQDYGSNDL